MSALKLVLLSTITLNQYTFAKTHEDVIDVLGSKKQKIATYKNLELSENNFEVNSFELSRLNVTSLKGASRTKFVQIRGVGERSDYTPLVFRSVGVFHEGIDYSNFPQALSGWGIAKQRVVYGPRLSERIAGYIESFDSKDKEKRFHLSLTDESSRQMGALYRGNRLSLSVFKKNSDGYYTNTYLNKDTNKKDELFVKGSYEIGSFKQIIHYTKQLNGYDAFDLDNTFNVASDRPGRDNLELTILRSEKKFEDLSIWYELLKANSLYSYDEDWASSNSYDYFISFEKKRSRHSVGMKYDFYDFSVKGEYVSLVEKQIEHGFNTGITRKFITGEIERNSFDVNLSYIKRLTKKTKLNTSLSIMTTNIEYENNLNFKKEKRFFPVSLSLSLEHSDSYIKLGMGSKSGGFSTEDDIPDERKVYNKELLYSLDTGHEVTLPSLNIIQRINVFINARKNTQVSTSFQDDPNDPSSFTFYIDNAASSYSYGLESKTTYLPSDWVKFVLDLGLISSQYGDYTVGAENLRNRELPYTPSYQLRLLVESEIFEGFYSSLILHKQDNYYFSNSHNQKGNGFETVDFRLSFNQGPRKYSFFINNIFDKDYQTRGFYFGNRPPNYEKELFTQRGRPRTVGVALDFAY
jgi:hypothetical protein